MYRHPSMNPAHSAELRQLLRRKIDDLEGILEPTFERTALFPGYFQVHERKCGNPGCHCSRGQLHPGTRILVPFGDGQGVVCPRPEEVEGWRLRTEAYKQHREARRRFRKWQAEVVKILDELERARRSLEGLSEEDARRPLAEGVRTKRRRKN
jgi:hypothetical protein